MSDEEQPVATPANAAPKMPDIEKSPASIAPAEDVSTAQLSGSGEPTTTSAPKRKSAPKKPSPQTLAAPAAALTTEANNALSTLASKPSVGASTSADTPGVAANTSASALSTAASKVTAMIPEGMGDKAKEIAGEVKDKASDAVEGLAKLIHDSAGAIDDNVGPKYGDYARSAAQSVTEAAERLRAKPVDEIADNTREFIRNKPGTALGIAAVTSLVLARIISAVFGKQR